MGGSAETYEYTKNSGMKISLALNESVVSRKRNPPTTKSRIRSSCALANHLGNVAYRSRIPQGLGAQLAARVAPYRQHNPDFHK